MLIKIGLEGLYIATILYSKLIKYTAMKKLTLLIVLLLSGIWVFGQDCGVYVELTGNGIFGQSEASVIIDDMDDVVAVTAEAIYKSTTVPTQARMWSENEEFFIEPVDIPINGIQGEGVITSVFRATFNDPAEEIHLDILDNTEEFYSLALYILRSNGTVNTLIGGELYHVYQNEDAPLVTPIPIPTSDHPRDIKIRFGISELNEDERLAVFQFEAGGQVEMLEIWEWDSEAGESKSYTLQEVVLEDVPGEVDEIVMTMISENYGGDRSGDSYVAGIVLIDVPCEYEESEGYCTYTQGFYGNEGGRTCAGETTRDLLARLLYDELVMGYGDHRFTIPAGGVDCVLDILPGGGPSNILPGISSCSDLNGIETNKKGRLRNALLAQGITLALNLRNSPDLLEFPVDGEIFMIRQTEDCSDPESSGIQGTEKEFAFSKEVADYLGEGATIEDLLNLVNMALAGEDISPLTLSMVSDAANLVNEAFDECVVVLEKDTGDNNADTGGEGNAGSKEGNGGNESTESTGGTQGSEGGSEIEAMSGATGNVTGIPDAAAGQVMKLYPNPAKDRFYVCVEKETGNIQSAIIYSVSGSPLRILRTEDISRGEQSNSIDISDLAPGLYIIKIDTGTGTFSQRFGIR